MSFRLTVEVPLFLSFFAFMLTYNVNTNLLIYRTCYVTLGYDKQNCSLLGNKENPIAKELEKKVQPKADVVAMVKTIVDSVSAAVLCLFVGTWSDRFGRKPILIINLLGYTLMNLVMVVYSALENVSPWYMMTCSLPVILTGGGASLLTVFLAYLTDVTTEEERGYRMGVFEVVMASAVLLGSSSSSYVLNATGYVAVFSIATVGCFLALVYIWCFLPESLEIRENTGRIKGFFDVQNMSGLFRTSFKPRLHFNRAIIQLIMLALALYFVVISGDGSVMFLFTRAKFQWVLMQYTWYSSACNVMWIIGTLVIVYLFHHKLHVKESVLILAGFVSTVIGAFIQGVASVDWLMYVAAVIRIPSSGISPMTRSLLSKLVDADEAGKIFALFNLTQNILGLVGSPVYTTLYNSTLNKNPGIFNFLTGAVDIVSTACILTVLILQRRTSTSTYGPLNAENDQENDESLTASVESTNSQRNVIINS